MAVMDQHERDAHNYLANQHIVDRSPAISLGAAILRVLCSIDERLATTNDFYLQNQEERNRPNG